MPDDPKQPFFFKTSDGVLWVREKDGTERRATMRELLDHDTREDRWPRGPHRDT